MRSEFVCLFVTESPNREFQKGYYKLTIKKGLIDLICLNWVTRGTDEIQILAPFFVFSPAGSNIFLGV